MLSFAAEETPKTAALRKYGRRLRAQMNIKKQNTPKEGFRARLPL